MARELSICDSPALEHKLSSCGVWISLPCGTVGSSWTRDWTHAPCIGAPYINPQLHSLYILTTLPCCGTNLTEIWATRTEVKFHASFSTSLTKPRSPENCTVNSLQSPVNANFTICQIFHVCPRLLQKSLPHLCFPVGGPCQATLSHGAQRSVSRPTRSNCGYCVL